MAPLSSAWALIACGGGIRIRALTWQVYSRGTYLCIRDSQTVEQIEEHDGHEEDEEQEDEVSVDTVELDVAGIELARQHHNGLDERLDGHREAIEVSFLLLLGVLLLLYLFWFAKQNVEAQTEGEHQNGVEGKALDETAGDSAQHEHVRRDREHGQGAH